MPPTVERFSERRWLEDSERGLQTPFLSTLLGSMCSGGKFERINNSQIVLDKNVYNRTSMLKSDVSGGNVPK